MHDIVAVRSAIVYLFENGCKKIPVEWDIQLSSFFGGAISTDANEKLNGTRKTTEGKDHMEFSLYQDIARCFLHHRDIFAWLYMLLQWNLMSRCDSVKTIAYRHMKVCQDSVGFDLPVTKNDRDGALFNVVGAKHVYANPTNPMVCPILALGVYLMCFAEVDLGGSHPDPDGIPRRKVKRRRPSKDNVVLADQVDLTVHLPQSSPLPAIPLTLNIIQSKRLFTGGDNEDSRFSKCLEREINGLLKNMSSLSQRIQAGDIGMAGTD